MATVEGIPSANKPGPLLSPQRDRPASKYRRPLAYSLAAAARSLWKQGILSSYRRDYWRFLVRAARLAPRQFSRAVALAIHAEHFIRYTFEDVLPRIEAPRVPGATSAAVEEAPSLTELQLYQITRRASGELPRSRTRPSR